MSKTRPPRVAIVHDWLTGMRGGEHVLSAILELFREPEIFTLISFPKKLSPRVTRFPIHTSWLQKIPGIEAKYRHALPLMPLAIRNLDVSKFDLVISSSHCVAKGIQKGPQAVHVCYIHAPMRYMWSRFDDYFGKGRASLLVRFAAWICRPFLRIWDRSTGSLERVNGMVANSQFIAQQAMDIYKRPCDVAHPFVYLEQFPFHPDSTRIRDYYLLVGAFAPYKRNDVAIEACLKLGRRLKIVGDGQEGQRLRAIVQNYPNQSARELIEFLGPRPLDELAQLYSGARALLFPGIEDFGITPLEAMASGTPVIAFGEGGLKETVVDGKTGIFFSTQSAQALGAAIQKLELAPIKSEDCRAQAEKFTKLAFQTKFREQIRQSWIAAGKDIIELEQALIGRLPSV